MRPPSRGPWSQLEPAPEPQVVQAPAPDLRHLQGQLGETMLRERHRLRMSLSRLQDAARQGRTDPAALAALAAQIEASAQRQRVRREALPVPSYPEELPVSEKRGEIARAIEDQQVVIVCGETGS